MTAVANASSDDFKELVRSRTDIVRLIGETVALHPNGRVFKGLCPFHDDHNPSFTVNPERQTYKCWSCGEGGDCFSFVMKQDAVNFPETLELLAKRAGLELPPKMRRGPAESKDKPHLYDVLEWAENEFHQCLLSTAIAERARNYLHGRGFNHSSIAKFKLGFHPESWDWLIQRAKGRFDTELLVRASLAKARDGGTGYYDQFVDRVMFPIHDDRTALDDYIAKPDSSFAWRLAETKEAADHTVFAIELTSQTWRTSEEVDRTVWKHWLMVIRPKVVASETGFLFITGGSHRDNPPDVEGYMVKMAVATKSVVAELKNVPNQPLEFKGGGRKMVEDDLITFTWNKFLETKDPEWPARLPMVKSAVRAMDAVQAFCATNDCGNLKVEKFAVAGGSKRGWTTWCTGAVDPRVVAIAPIVIDVVNVRKSMRNHLEGYGFWAPSVGDYVRGGLTLKDEDPAYIELMEIEDPYVYRDRYKMPKLVLNAAGDQFFTPDSSRFYYHDLPGEKLLRYVPNTDHGLGNSDGRETLVAFYDSVVRNLKRPKYSWKFLDNGAIRVETVDRPKEVKLWKGHNPKARDFRLEEVGPIYTSVPVQEIEPGVYVGKIDAPKEGFTAFFVELTHDIGSHYPMKVTTDVRVLPEVLPFQGIAPTQKMGGAKLREAEMRRREQEKAESKK